jgi:hypothetical protein
VRLAPAWRTVADELVAWPGLEVIERQGCDVAPVDVATEEGRLTLRSYVWPDQEPRLRRLESAFLVAGEVPAAVRAQNAAAFVQGLQLADGATTVLWHSVMWQYLSRDEQRAVTARIDELGEEATESAPFAHAFLEPLRRAPDRDHEFLVVLRLWPGGERRILGASAGHGVPTVWE